MRKREYNNLISRFHNIEEMARSLSRKMYNWENVENAFEGLIKAYEKRDLDKAFSLLQIVNESYSWQKLKDFIFNTYEKEEAETKWYELTSLFVLYR